MDFHGVKMAVTHFVTQFTHVVRHLEFRVENKKKLFRENCFENVVSDVKKNGLCVHKTTFRKKCKNKIKLNLKKTMKTLKIFGGFWGQN